MNGFHAGGEDAAKQALTAKYETRLNELSALLERTSVLEVEQRERLEQEVSRCREEYRAALAGLRRSLF